MSVCRFHKEWSLFHLQANRLTLMVDEINGAATVDWHGVHHVSAKVSCLERLEYTICDIRCKIQLKIFNYLCLDSV